MRVLDDRTETRVALTPSNIALIEYALRVTNFESVLEAPEEDEQSPSALHEDIEVLMLSQDLVRL